MIRSTRCALPVLLLLAAAGARADCHWAWHCDQSSVCGFVPFCDKPTDRPPPLRGMLLPRDDRPAPLPPDASSARKPLQGFKPVQPPPARPVPGARENRAVRTKCAHRETGQAPSPAVGP